MRFAIALSAVFAMVVTIPPATARAQLTPAPVALSVRPVTEREQSAKFTSLETPPAREWIAPRSKRAEWWIPLVSAVVPGAGQALLGQQRSVAYVAAEAYLITQLLNAQRDVNAGIRTYQSIANDDARKDFPSARPKGPWSYYETMENEAYDASGAFDVVPGGPVDPETDLSTYNGVSWQQARELFFSDPSVTPSVTSREYQAALAFYTARAVRDEFRWSWRGAGFQRENYRLAIGAVNRSNQRKTNMVTVIGANHLASLIDAYVTVRIRRYGGAGVAGLRMDAVNTTVATVGDPANGHRLVRTAFRLVPAERRAR